MSAVGGILGPQGPPLLLPRTPQGLSTCSYRVSFTLGFTDLLGSPVGVPSESQHCCLANERGGQFPAVTPLLSSLCPGADPPGRSAGPKPGEKTRQGPPWCPELRGGVSGQTPRLLPQGGQEGWPLHDAGLGALAAGLIIVVHEFAWDLPGDEGEAAGGRGVGTNCERRDRPC